MREHLGVCLLCRFGATLLRHIHCLYVWVFVTIYGSNWYCYHRTSSVNPISPTVKTLYGAFLCAWRTTNIYSNVWRLIDSDFWIPDSTLVKAYCDSEGMIKHGLLPILFRKIQFYLIFWGQAVYCHPPWSLFVQCADHLLTCRGESQMKITKHYIVSMNCLNLYLLLLILNCLGSFHLSVSIRKRDILK